MDGTVLLEHRFGAASDLGSNNLVARRDGLKDAFGAAADA
jgi:hypothetical protein